MALGEEDLSEEALTSGMTASGTLLELQFIRGLRVCFSIKEMWKMRKRVLKNWMAPSTVKRIINLRREH